MASKAKAIMVQGTASDAGKSVLTTALCRIFHQDGKRVAPFKSQNMSLNSYVTPDGKEIGRAQGVQAEACGIAATADMNPILLKPMSNMMSQVVVQGKPLSNMDALEYWNRYLPHAGRIVRECLDRLRDSCEIVVMEGAGSPAEINLKSRDIVNMYVAEWAEAPVLLVANIDRGGMFASVVGTLALLTPKERKRVKGIIVNKFRGDKRILQPGIDWLERKTRIPVAGVVPYIPKLGLEEEDSVSLDAEFLRHSGNRVPDGYLDIAVIQLPHIANFTDFDPLPGESDVYFRYINKDPQWGNPDAVIIPGSKNTAEDLLFLSTSGLAEKIQRHIQNGGRLLGICGGYQMLGRNLLDPWQVESEHGKLAGLGIFPMETVFAKDKTTIRVQGICEDGFGDLLVQGPCPVEGYEIHMGVTNFIEPVFHPLRIRDAHGSRPEGASTQDGKVWGTYLHGILHNDRLRRKWLNSIRRDKGWQELEQVYCYDEQRTSAFDRLADCVREHVDMKYIYQILSEGVE